MRQGPWRELAAESEAPVQCAIWPALVRGRAGKPQFRPSFAAVFGDQCTVERGSCVCGLEIKRVQLEPQSFHRGCSPVPRAIVISQAHVLFVLGGLCIALPVFLIGLTPLFAVCRMSSLSHYFYVPIVGNIMVTALALMAGTLVLLRPSSVTRTVVYRLAAGLFVLLAVFPISGDGCSQTEYTGLAFYHFDYAHPGQVGVMHHLQLSLGSFELSNHEVHVGAGLLLACLLTILCFDWRSVRFVHHARRNGFGTVAPTFWTVRNVCCLGVCLCFIGGVTAYAVDSSWVDGYRGIFPPELAFQSGILVFFGAAILAEARSQSEMTSR